MTDQYEPFAGDFDRQFIDATHPLYVSPASIAPVASGPNNDEHFDPATRTIIRRGDGRELGPWGKRFVYAWFAVGAAYFALVLLFGAH